MGIEEIDFFDEGTGTDEAFFIEASGMSAEDEAMMVLVEIAQEAFAADAPAAGPTGPCVLRRTRLYNPSQQKREKLKAARAAWAARHGTPTKRCRGPVTTSNPAPPNTWSSVIDFS